jgi:hypothetical protein
VHEDPIMSAKAMTNKHVVKMILESAQLLSTAHRFLDGHPVVGLSPNGRKSISWHLDDKEMDSVLYKCTHVNHPSSVWCRETTANYNWLYQHFIALCDEYTDRYGKIHLSRIKLENFLNQCPKNLRLDNLTTMSQAMPDSYRCADSVQAYRNYYEAEKLHSQEDKDRYTKILKGNKNG